MNNNHERFHLCLNIYFRPFFGAMFVDVSKKPMQYTIGYIAMWTIFLLMEIGCIYTFFNAHELSISPIYAIGICIGASQVSKYNI